MEILTIIGGIIGAIIASWGGVFLNNRYQFRVQKENHERQIRTEVLTNAAKAMVNTRLIFIRLPTLPLDKVDDYIIQNVTPPEFCLWATNKTIQAALDLGVVMMEEVSHLTPLKVLIYEKEKELQIINPENSYSSELRNEMYALIKQFTLKCHQSYLKTGIAEIKVIACIREELGVSFNEAEYHKMTETYNNQCMEIMNMHGYHSH